MLVLLINNFLTFNSIYNVLNLKKKYNFCYLVNIKKNINYNCKKIFLNFKKFFLLKILKKKKHFILKNIFFYKIFIINKNIINNYLFHVKYLLRKNNVKLLKIKKLNKINYYCLLLENFNYKIKILIFII